MLRSGFAMPREHARGGFAQLIANGGGGGVHSVCQLSFDQDRQDSMRAREIHCEPASGAVNKARRGEGMPNVEHAEMVRQAVNMTPLGWAPVTAGSAGSEWSDGGRPQRW